MTITDTDQLNQQGQKKNQELKRNRTKLTQLCMDQIKNYTHKKNSSAF